VLIIGKQSILIILVLCFILAFCGPVSAMHPGSGPVSNSTNTNMGDNVRVQIETTDIHTPVILNFSTVSQSGNSSVSELNSAPDIPSNFTIGEPIALLEINTNAKYTGSIIVAVNYTDLIYQNESALRLLHCENGVWFDCTTSIDTVNKMIYGLVNSLSPFAIITQNTINDPNNGNQNNMGTIPTQIHNQITNTITQSKTVQAASQTTRAVEMQTTGAPIVPLAIAVVSILGGLAATRRK
jgi:hypothetical protein